MRIGIGFRTPHGVANSIDHITGLARVAADAGLDHIAFPDEFGIDPLLAAGIVGQRVPGIGLVVGVASMYPRHPLLMAAQALAVQAACGDRLTLGVGASHRIGVEGVYGYSYARPVERMREYLAVLHPALRGDPVDVDGAHVRAHLPGPLPVHGGSACPVLLAALGPQMVDLAGRAADGVITGFAGPRTLAEIVPAVRAAATGRAAPRVVAALPVLVDRDAAAARATVSAEWGMASAMPAYAAVFRREGVADAGGVAVVGAGDALVDQLQGLQELGVTDLCAQLVGSAEAQRRTIDALGALGSVAGPAPVGAGRSA